MQQGEETSPIYHECLLEDTLVKWSLEYFRQLTVFSALMKRIRQFKRLVIR
jgi:hypothetical protein